MLTIKLRKRVDKFSAKKYHELPLRINIKEIYIDEYNIPLNTQKLRKIWYEIFLVNCGNLITYVLKSSVNW